VILSEKTAPIGRVATVAVVDGNPSHSRHVVDALMSLYKVVCYTHTNEALAGMRASVPDVVIVDDEVKALGGFDFIKLLRSEAAFATIPMIITSRATHAQIAAALRQSGANAFLAKPYRRSQLIKIITHLRNKSIEERWKTMSSLQREALEGTVEVFNNISDVIATGEPVQMKEVTDVCAPLVSAVGAGDYKGILNGVRDHDNYSYAHSMRVATLLTVFGKVVGLTAGDQMVLASGGLLHDVGKMTIPHEVLNKPGKLEGGEWDVMRGHVKASVEYLERTPGIPKAAIIVAGQHHEKLDGTGYPNGLKGAQLNELARMAAIVDVFSALTDRRVYKPSMGAEKALAIMEADMKNHLDGHLVLLFKQMLLDAVGE
jgi:putative nucleotidyltransferase with HDIG domain